MPMPFGKAHDDVDDSVCHLKGSKHCLKKKKKNSTYCGSSSSDCRCPGEVKYTARIPLQYFTKITYGHLNAHVWWSVLLQY